MWYFAWLLGLGLVVCFGVLNGIWYEFGLPAEEGDAAMLAHGGRDPH